MPINTRSKTRSGQPPDLVTSSRANPPRRLTDSRQGNAVVVDNNEAGSPSVVAANGNHLVASFTIGKCKKPRCMTCPLFSTNYNFKSNVTQKNYTLENPSGENLNCQSQNVIYLLTCNNCNIQYVGETTTRLNERMNRHRTATSGCQHIINHFKDTCVGATFSTQILEKFSGSGYIHNKVCPDARSKRLDREEYWMKTLRTLYPYGLNERARENGDDDTLIGSLFPPLPRTGERQIRTRHKRNVYHQAHSFVNFFDQLNSLLNNNLNISFNTIRIILNKTKKKVLKDIAASILCRDPNIHYHINKEQWYHYILDIIDTKLYKNKTPSKRKKDPPKNICTVDFLNKGLEFIRLSSIIKLPANISHLPEQLQCQENIPVVTYKLGATIRNKILNYKDTVESIYIDEDVSFITNTGDCQCSDSEFCDPHHKHIVTGDLRIVENTKLRKLLSKGPNYREPCTINFNKCISAITAALTTCITNLSDKYKIKAAKFTTWKNTIMSNVIQKIAYLKTKTLPSPTKSTLNDPDVMAYLEELRRHFVIVPIDKAANNFSFICKKYYVSRILQEVGLNGSPSTTYNNVDIPKADIINDNANYCNKFDLKLTEKQKALPIMYWLPKMHKTPIGCRFIIASKQCSTKPLTKVISIVFKMIFNTVESFHNKSRFYSRLNKFWVVQNSFPVTDKLDKINIKNNAKSISTYDFSTLYTKIPHDLLIQILCEIIDFIFKGSMRNRIGFSEKSVYWTSKGVDKRFFTKDSLKAAVKHLISKCYFVVGNTVFIQKIGIPMGIDPAPFWANLFLYHYERKFITTLGSQRNNRGFKYHGVMRFIDDLCAINDGGDFGNSFLDIYPPELELKVEHEGPHATFLDLDISIAGNRFIYKLYDKRDNFNFFIVRMPQMTSNIPSTVFYGSVLSEFLRIARCTLLFEDFIPKANQLFKRMVTQGGNKSLISRQILKACLRHPAAFLKFNQLPQNILTAITAGQ